MNALKLDMKLVIKQMI